MDNIIPADKEWCWAILRKWETYNTIDKLSEVLNRPVNEKMLDDWLAVDGIGHLRRQQLVWQSYKPEKCC